MKKLLLIALVLALFLYGAITTQAASVSVNWLYDTVTDTLQPIKNAVNARILGSSFHATSTATSSTFAILNEVRYVEQFPGADAGAKAMAAYSSAPDDVTLVFTASSTYSSMVFDTIGKHVKIECAPGVVLTYAGSASSTVFATFVYPDYPTDAGVDGCIFDGPSGSTAVGWSLGNSTAGAAGYKFRNFTIQDFGVGIVSGANTYLTSFDNFVLQNNNRALTVYAANNSGENLRYSNGLIGDCKTIADCAYFATSSSASTLWEGMSLDNAQLKIATGNFNFNVIGGHCENPAAQAAVIGKYACIVNNGETTSINGLSVVNMATSSAQTPDAFIINSGYLNIFSASVWAANSISAPAFVSNTSAATANIYGFNELGTSIDTIATSSVGFYIADNRNVGVGTSSPAGLFDVNGSAFFGNQTGTAQLTLRAGSGRNGTIGQEGTSATSALAFNSNGSLDFRTDGTSKMFVTDLGLVGVGTLFPQTLFQVAGTSTLATTTVTDLWVSRGLRDTFNLTGTSGQVLQTTGTSTRWVSTSSLGIAGGGSTAWGAITGTLSSQTDLQTALNAKLNLTGGTLTGDFTAPTTTLATTTASRLTITNLGSGLLKATSGLIGLATAGTDYIASVTGDWTGTFDGQEGSYYLNRANHTGTMLAAAISDFVSTVRTSISETITGLTYTSGTGDLSLDSGYVISTTTRETNQDTAFSWGNHASQGYLTAIATTSVRGMLSSSATGLTYNSATGDFSLTAGSVIPLTASTTAWESFYQTPSTRITAGVNCSWAGNTFNCTGGTGDVVGPSAATDNAVARFDTTTGKLIQNASTTISDSGSIVTGNTTGNQSITISSGSGRNGIITQVGSAANSPLTFNSNGALDLQVDSISRLNIGEFGDIVLAATTTMPTTTISRLTVSNFTGLLKGTSGLVSVATPGTDYVAAVTGDWTGTFDGQEGTYYLSRANHTGTQSSTTITGLGSLAGLSSVDISSHTNLTGDSEIVLTGDTLSIAASIARDSELHSPITLSGALDYITLVGQDIVRGAIDLATDITGILADDNGGTGQSTYATGDMLYASGANTLAKRTIGSTGNVLSVVGGVPTWVATGTLGIAGGGGGGSGTVNSGTTGQMARYNSAGTAVTGTSTVFVADNSDVRVGNNTITPNIPFIIERNSPTGYTSAGIYNPAADGRAQWTMNVGAGSNYYDFFIGASGSSTANYPNTMEVGCGFSGCGVNFWSDGFLQARMATTGNMGFGTTTNLTAKLAVQSFSLGQKVAQFFDHTGSTTMSVTNATSTVRHASVLTGFAQDVLARITIGIDAAIGYYRSGKLFGALTVAGLIYQEAWNQIDCSQLVGAVAIAADGLTGCDGFSFYEDGTETLTATTEGGNVFARLSTSLTAGGAGVFANAPSTGAFIFGTSTPKLEVTARMHTVQNWATSTKAYIGFTNLATAAATYEIEPTVGCYFMASSTQANWQAVCRTSAAAQTVVDTGVATTTTTGTGNSRPYRFFLEADSLEARFFIQSSEAGNLNQVAGITTNVPTTVALNAGAHFGSNTGITARGIDVYDMNFGWRKVLR